ncbi:transposase [Vibrio sp. 2-Bac 85]
MSRPLRLEFAGALYHVTSRGNGRNIIYLQDDDFELFLAILADVCDRYNWVVHAYCLMTNHYHLLVETLDANLSKGMRHLNGVFTQSMNRRHGRVGHLFQGRYKAILVDKDVYLLYIVLNPIRAKMVNSPDEWLWSSWHCMLGNVDSPEWLSTDALLKLFANNRRDAIRA